MADVNKRIVVEVDSEGAEQGLAPVRRVVDDITSSAKLSGEAIDTAFENALRNAKNLEDVLKNVKDELAEIAKAQPNFGKERERLMSEFGNRLEPMAPGRARQDVVKERNEALKQLSSDEAGQAAFNRDFSDSSKRLISTLEDLIEEEKKHRGAGEGGPGQANPSYLGGLFAQRSALLNKQLAAPTRRAASSYRKQISHLNRQIANLTRGNGVKGALGQGGIGIAGALLGTDAGLLGAIGGGWAVLALEIGNKVKEAIKEGNETLQASNRASLIAPGSISRYGPTGPNGEELEGGIYDTRTGMTPSQRSDYYVNLVRQRGRATANSGMEAYQQALLENAFGMQRGQLAPLERFRVRDTGRQDVNNLVEAFITASKQENLFGFNKDDFSQFNDRLSNVVQLIRDQQQNMNSVNMPSAFATIMMGQQIGGRFADRDTQVGLFNQLNTSIRNPGNDFRRAFIFQRLQQAHPNATPFEIQEMMENGIYGGNLNAVLSGISRPGAGAGREELDQYLYQIQGLTGLSYQASRTLGQSIMRNPNILNQPQNLSQIIQSIRPGSLTDTQGRNVEERAKAALTAQQDVSSYFKQKMSDIGVALNKIVEATSGSDATLKSIYTNPATYIAPWLGIGMGLIQSHNTTKKSVH